MNITVTHELSFKAYYMSLKKKSNLYGEILMQEYLIKYRNNRSTCQLQLQDEFTKLPK